MELTKNKKYIYSINMYVFAYTSQTTAGNTHKRNWQE